ncbi:MAG: DegT/DnrJ/EryC1/StrS family aminotransferase [bacterium]|nr:DegT/DnrJ/EryC1/StrS family aminotransferase [bacterium]
MNSRLKIPFGTLSITQRSKNLVQEVLESGRVSCGKYVGEFEEKFASLTGTKEAVAVSSGTDADALALAVLYDFGAKRVDEVIVPALSFVATGNSVLQAGFRPVFVDIRKDTLNIDPEKIEEAITGKTKAIMPVHLMGKPADMDAINKIAKKYSLYVIEDAAEAHGAKYKGKNVGTLGHMAAYSLYLAHIITSIEGGIVTTDDSNFAEILRSLRSHGRACKCKKCVLNISSSYCPKRFQYGEGIDVRFVFERIGFSCKMNEIEAAVGLGSLEIYEEILKKRKNNFDNMSKKFKRFNQYLASIEEETYEKIGPHAFPIILKENAKFTRDQFVDFLERNGIETRSLFSSMPTQCAGFEFLGYKLGEFPNAEYIEKNGLHIGVHQDINEEHINYFIEVVEDFLDRIT